MCARNAKHLIGIKKNNMIQKLLILILLGVALYVHNLPMFFGMILAYIVGADSMIRQAMKMNNQINELLDKVIKQMEEDKK